jgi:hypothetical protein
MAKKRYELKTTCPQCGCSAVSNLSEKELKERFGNVPNVEMECSECMHKYHAKMSTACPLWDKECRMKEKFPELYQK